MPLTDKGDFFMVLRRCSIFIFLLLCTSLSMADRQDWLPITDQDMKIKSVPGNDGASAIQLNYQDFIDDVNHSEFFYKRIKILNDKGLKYADVEIPVYPDTSLRELKGRTIHPDGKIIEFTGKPFQKTLIKTRGVKILAKTFSLPDVTPGSIVEYKYTIDRNDYGILNNEWIVQHDLYTVKESFRMHAYQGWLTNEKGETGKAQVSAVFSRMPGSLRPKLKGETYEMEAENMPAFETEAYMPPESAYKPQVRFFYAVVAEGVSPDKFWTDFGQQRYEKVEHFIGNSGEVREAAAQAVGSETDPEKKVRKLYARAQQIKNISYERDRDSHEVVKDIEKPSQSAAEVLKRGYSSRNGITRLFVAMARSQGFIASVLAVSDRSERFFDKGVLSGSQLDDEIALVKLNGQDVYLDPATKYCPYGLLRWMRTNTTALTLDKKTPTFIMVPSASYKNAVMHRNANMQFNENGDLRGEIAVEFSGSEALEHRLEALDTDNAGRDKALEDEVASWLSAGAIVKATGSTGWDSADGNLTVAFHVEIPGFSSVAGKKMLMPSYLFQVKQKDAFKHNERKYPVYFPYAFSEVDSVSIQLPAGYIAEGSPQDQITRLPYAHYQVKVKNDGAHLLTERMLLLNGFFFEPANYGEVKDFFGKVQAGDEQQFIIRSLDTKASAD